LRNNHRKITFNQSTATINNRGRPAPPANKKQIIQNHVPAAKATPLAHY